MKMQIRSEQGCHLHESDGHYVDTVHQGEVVEVLARGSEEEEEVIPLGPVDTLQPGDPVLIRTRESQGWVTWGELLPVSAPRATASPN